MTEKIVSDTIFLGPTESRPDLALICEWVEPRARVLDLGCGDGTLLERLTREREVTGFGLEIDDHEVAACITRGVDVIQSDVDEGLAGYDDRSFDVVVMTQALQALNRPRQVIGEMLRVGRRAIVTFPNFGHWRARLALLRGRMPVTGPLPHAWHDTPNIHLCTVRDFDALCHAEGWRVERRALLNQQHRSGRLLRRWPNLFCEIAVYELTRG
jgi:methionine biosynthesis protein MetW